MADTNDSTTEPAKDILDLSSLNALSLGPNWGTGRQPQPRMPREGGRFEGRRERSWQGHEGGDRAGGQGGPDRRDRRGAVPRRRHEFAERQERPIEQPFSPVVEADFYPEEEPFRVLSQAIRHSSRTFELFEIARLILEKPDRFVCVVRDPEQRENEPTKLFACVVDGLPFRNEEEVLGHVFRHYLGEFFTLEEVEGEAPSGSYPMVHKCGITGEVIAPPNYHRYKSLCREHHAAKLAHLPYERFEQKLESSREEEDIRKWQEKMKKHTRYTLKEQPELQFNTLEDARLHLLTHAKEKLVRGAYSARFSGKALALLSPDDPIRRSIEFHLEGQRRFPLSTANHLRGRLRRMKFAVYKRGSKGISFVCAVKRRFRKPDERFADNLQELIDFLEAHPNFPAKDLPKAYLGIEPESAPSEGGEQPKVEPPLVLRQLKNDLRYLVSEGYVIEYSDGRLLVPAQQETSSKDAGDSDEHEESTPAKHPVGAAVSPKTENAAPVAPEPVVESEPAAETVSEVEPQPEDEGEAEVQQEPVPEPVAEPESAAEPERIHEPEPAEEPEADKPSTGA